MTQWLALLAIGLMAGTLSGMFGVGGGVIIVPMLALLLGFSQHEATGTSLLVFLLPIGVLGALEYYKAGKISAAHLKYAVAIASGLFVGSLLGSKLALSVSEEWLRRGFALLLVVVAIRLWFKA